jgi:hypothetical protein
MAYAFRIFTLPPWAPPRIHPECPPSHRRPSLCPWDRASAPSGLFVSLAYALRVSVLSTYRRARRPPDPAPAPSVFPYPRRAGGLRRPWDRRPRPVRALVSLAYALRVSSVLSPYRCPPPPGEHRPRTDGPRPCLPPVWTLVSSAYVLSVFPVRPHRWPSPRARGPLRGAPRPNRRDAPAPRPRATRRGVRNRKVTSSSFSRGFSTIGQLGLAVAPVPRSARPSAPILAPRGRRYGAP